MRKSHSKSQKTVKQKICIKTQMFTIISSLREQLKNQEKANNSLSYRFAAIKNIPGRLPENSRR